MIEHLEAIVHGRVQGVGFRWFVRERAAQLALGGWVRNRWDGAVEVSAEGDAANLDRLLEALGSGPSGAQVERLEIVRRDRSVGNLARPWAGAAPSFEIRPGAHRGD